MVAGRNPGMRVGRTTWLETMPAHGGPVPCDRRAGSFGSGGSVDESLRVPGATPDPHREVKGDPSPEGGQSPVAVVWGGSAGIGLACSEGLAALGFSVAILGR